MQTTEFDAIVVGSGITGGWAAKELAEKGLKVLVLERGKAQPHGQYHSEHMAKWNISLRNRPPRALYASDYPIQSRNGEFDETSRHLWNNDRENPYVQAKPYNWFQGGVVGGRSLLWGRQVDRWSDLDFEANKRDGHGNDWPIRYADLAPWYSYVERFIGVSGQAEKLPQLPDSEFLPPMAMFEVEKCFKERVEAKFKDRRVTIGRVAVLTQPHNGRGACHYCGPCYRGCAAGAHFSSQSSTLPAYADNVVTLDRRTDRFGIPLVKFDVTFRENEVRMRRDAIANAAAMLAASGAIQITPFHAEPIPGNAIHELGGARMGNDPTESVLNRYNQAHDVRNLFVTDGSCMASSSCVNPSLTYMALTARAVDWCHCPVRFAGLTTFIGAPCNSGKTLTERELPDALVSTVCGLQWGPTMRLLRDQPPFGQPFYSFGTPFDGGFTVWQAKDFKALTLGSCVSNSLERRWNATWLGGNNYAIWSSFGDGLAITDSNGTLTMTRLPEYPPRVSSHARGSRSFTRLTSMSGAHACGSFCAWKRSASGPTHTLITSRYSSRSRRRKEIIRCSRERTNPRIQRSLQRRRGDGYTPRCCTYFVEIGSLLRLIFRDRMRPSMSRSGQRAGPVYRRCVAR